MFKDLDPLVLIIFIIAVASVLYAGIENFAPKTCQQSVEELVESCNQRFGDTKKQCYLRADALIETCNKTSKGKEQ